MPSRPRQKVLKRDEGGLNEVEERSGSELGGIMRLTCELMRNVN